MKHRIRVALLRVGLLRLSLAAGLLALVCGVLVGRAIEQHWLGDRVMPRVVVWGMDYGGWTKDRVRVSLEQRKADWGQRRCVLMVGEHGFPTTPGEVGFDFDVARVMSEVAASGRVGSWWKRWGWRIARLATAQQVSLQASFDATKLQAKVDELQAKGIADPPVEGKVVIEGSVARGVTPRAGTRIAFGSVQQTWLEALRTNLGEDELRVVLPLERHEPQLEPQALAGAVERAQRLIAGPMTLSHDWGELTIQPSTLAEALQCKIIGSNELQLRLEDAVIDKVLAPLRVALEQSAANARFVVGKDDSLTVEPSLTARRIVTQEVTALLWDVATKPERRTTLPIREVDEATLTTAQAQALGVTERVSTFVTYFPCCQPRVKNIERMAELLDGTVLRPGETLSVNERIGERTKARGFVAGPTIVEGEMEDTFGGGVSQFATTLFNAVLQGGYQIIERQAHSYYFPRYPLGHEATLSFPKPDLIFKNDTQFGLLIQARCTKTSIRITLYGNNEDRKVERKLSAAFDFTDPPVDYVPDDKMKPDEHEEMERGSRGFSVLVTRVVTPKNGERHEESRKVVYKPREAVVAVHPCNIPKEDDDHTGEECPKPDPEEELLEADPATTDLSHPTPPQ